MAATCGTQPCDAASGYEKCLWFGLPGMLSELRTHCPALYPCAAACYPNPNLLMGDGFTREFLPGNKIPNEISHEISNVKF